MRTLTGPPAVRDKDNPDGFSGDNLDPNHAAELNRTKMLLDRSFQLAIAANKSPKKTTIILENPADKSVPNTLPYGEDTKNHGSIWATSHFKDLKASIPNGSIVTFSFCRFGSDYQKYTTLWYTNEAGPVLDQLSSPAYQCNHAKHPKIAGGRLPNGTWASAAAAAYPAQLNVRLAMALTHARTGDPRPVREQRMAPWANNAPPPQPSSSAPPPTDLIGECLNDNPGITHHSSRDSHGNVGNNASAPASPISHSSSSRALHDLSPPRNFPSLSNVAPSPSPSPTLGRVPPPVQGGVDREVRSKVRGGNASYDQQLRDYEDKRQRAVERRLAKLPLSPVAEEDDSPYDIYSPFSLGSGGRR